MTVRLEGENNCQREALYQQSHAPGSTQPPTTLLLASPPRTSRPSLYSAHVKTPLDCTHAPSSPPTPLFPHPNPPSLYSAHVETPLDCMSPAPTRARMASTGDRTARSQGTKQPT
jgi:hypothetical protein